MWLHIKASMQAQKRPLGQPTDAPVEEDIGVWSNGRPGKQVQLIIGEHSYIVEADELIDAIRRCSK